MKTKDAIQHFGSVKALASALNISKQAVYKWGEFVDPLRQFQIEVLTRGKIKADRDFGRVKHAA